MSKFKLPSAYTILFGLIIVVGIATYIVPAGEYDRETNEALGRDVPVPGTYKEVAANPEHLGAKIGFFAVLHTWGQKMENHPHLHCVIPAGG